MRERHGFTKEQRGPMYDGQDPQRFGNYDLVRRIDVGGMGEVYLAHQRTAFGREVAVKIIRSDLVHDLTARKRFLREAEVSAYLKHEHILPLLEFGEEQGRLFLVTPYIKGGTLGKRLQSGSISLSEVHQLFTSLVQSVAYLHKRGVIHRDLKPSNILLDGEEDSDRISVRLIDFGIASLQGTLAANAQLTTSGFELGTEAYMAPERLHGVAAPSNDIYSLGIILYQMLTGQLPQKGHLIVLPQPLEYVVGHCTEENPAERFSSAEELLQSFERACKALTGSIRLPIVAAPAIPVVAPEVFKPGDSATIRRIPLSSNPEQPATQSNPSHPPISTGIVEPIPSTPRAGGSLPLRPPRKVEVRLPPPSQDEAAFANDDYNSPTTYIGPARTGPARGKKQALAHEAVLVSTPSRSRPKRRNRSVGMFISAAIIIIIALIAGLSFFTLQAATTANITITPSVQTVSSVFTLTATPGSNPDNSATSTAIPAYVLNSQQKSTQSGATTGRAECVLGIFQCKQAVSFNDIDALAAQGRVSTKAPIQQDLQRQVASNGVTAVGAIVYQDLSVTADPQQGSVSKTVTVTLTEQGSLEGIKTKDVHDRALALLKSKLTQNYTLLDQMTQIGQPSIQKVDANGNVTIMVAAGGVASYQIPDDELATIQNHIKGMSQKDARAFIAKQANIDPAAISIRISYGDNIPNNIQQIKLATINPTNLPPVRLTPVPTAAVASTP